MIIFGSCRNSTSFSSLSTSKTSLHGTCIPYPVLSKPGVSFTQPSFCSFWSTTYQVQIFTDADCGVFVCMGAYCIFHGLELNYSSTYQQEYRLHILEVLANTIIPNHHPHPVRKLILRFCYSDDVPERICVLCRKWCTS